MRHNQGGSSYWSSQIAKELWGEKVVEQKKIILFKTSKCGGERQKIIHGLCRVSLDVVKDQPEVLKIVKTVAAGMALSLKSGDPFYVEQETNTLNNIPKESLVSDFKTKVFVMSICNAPVLV
ncbi:hypothetical protein ACOBV9_19255 (plasmid) [Pseudoalteromonas espejiana]